VNPYQETLLKTDRAEREAALREARLGSDLAAAAVPESSLFRLLSVVRQSRTKAVVWTAFAAVRRLAVGGVSAERRRVAAQPIVVALPGAEVVSAIEEPISS
jgi:hypothetical protein